MLRIVEDDLSGDDIAALLREHMRTMIDNTPPESVHALDIEGLRGPNIVVWSARQGAELLGCAALKELDAVSGEIKSMKSADAHRGRGVASALLDHVIAVAKQRGYKYLRLETGSSAVFQPALALYRKYGFYSRGPFADYVEDRFSRYMELAL